MTETIYEVIEPRPVSARKDVRASTLLTDLNDAVVAEVWDYVFRGDEMFAVVEEELTRRYPGIRFVTFSEFGDIHGPDEVAVLEALPQLFREKQINAVLAGVGA